jgi:uncharacterized OsmC-like protein
MSSDIREYDATARSTASFGRVLCSARNHHVVIDGPVQNGCPGEALTPVEAFLMSVAACGVELVQVIARDRAAPVGDVRVRIYGRVDRANPVRQDCTVFNSVRLGFEIDGVSDAVADEIVHEFRRR